MTSASPERQAAGYSHRIGSKYVAPPLQDYGADALRLQRALIDKRERMSWRTNLAYLLVVILTLTLTFFPWRHV